MSDKTITTTQTKVNWKTRIRQMGVAAFLFFLIKGLIWLAIFFGLGTWIKDLF
jgi:Na+/H+ antiporter NhaC